MSEQDNKDPVIAGEVEENTTGEQTTQNKEKSSRITNDVLTRILVTILFALIGWVSLWVFCVVVLVQFGFLLITGNLNKNLKAFNGELGSYLSDIIHYVAFQTEQKPFPFKSWDYDDDKEKANGEATQS
ncbi:DUF4389 domain-containing protein [Marinicella sediminis]|uniref:DUF4389 domain-containing protein n=1 Tax=Marinicella sediminis TaxID=1792834 RepID=A0ABV7JDH7_9GAMM|nr:DUF4389 domain-containing protein [Marinicella sediminis]